MKPVLKKLNKDGYGDIQVRDTKAYQDLLHAQQACQHDPLNTDCIEKEQMASRQYKQVHADYTSFMQQKAKITWLTYGDETSKLFHQSLRIKKGSE